MSVTEGDRERAADWIESVLDNWVGAFDHSNDEARDRVYVLTELAAAFAEEREKARVPFLALADEFDAESSGAMIRAEAMPRTDENVRHHTAERRHARVAQHHAASLRRAAEVSE